MAFHPSSTTAELGIYCKKCGYDLRACLEHRCSECGRDFNPDDPLTFRQHPPRVRLRKWVKRSLLLLLVIALPPIAVWGWLWWGLLAENQIVARTTNLDVNPWPIGGDWGVRIYFRMERLAFVLCRIDAVDFTEAATDQDVITDAVPIQQFKWLHSLSLGHAKITDVGLEQLPELKELQSLRMRDMKITDASLSCLRKYLGLKSLALSRTNVNDAGLVHIRQLTELQELFLNGTQVTDAGLIHLKELKTIRYINLHETKVTEAGVKELQAALPNTKIVFDNITTNPQ